MTPPKELFEETDQLAPARGIATALWFSLGFWGVLALAWWAA
tara:strand:- start:134 stop:259 length:126 start_codon:yes stop_codon:yes gene_type:complete